MSLIRSKIDYGCQAYMSAMFLQREIKLAIPDQTNTIPINTHLLSKHHMQPGEKVCNPPEALMLLLGH